MFLRSFVLLEVVSRLVSDRPLCRKVQARTRHSHSVGMSRCCSSAKAEFRYPCDRSSYGHGDGSVAIVRIPSRSDLLCSMDADLLECDALWKKKKRSTL